MKVLLTGATGLIGQALRQSLINDQQTVARVSRRPVVMRHDPEGAAYQWNPEAEPVPAAALQGVEAIVHLAGEPVAAHRWTAEQKKRIRDSRIIGTRNLVAALSQIEPRPRVLVSASAVGFYGDRGDEQLDEDSPAGNGFLSEVCQQWDDESGRAAELGLRVAQVRIGVVLSAKGGALPRLLPAFKLGVAGRLGGGRQWFPWIHLDDVVGLIRHIIHSSALSGPVNAVAPGIVTNADFTKEMAEVLHRPAILPAPSLALRLVMGEMADVLLASQRVIPRAALSAGYQFRYPTLKTALENLLTASSPATHTREAA
jgi:uncharacterized protein (TIGR01777 family)